MAEIKKLKCTLSFKTMFCAFRSITRKAFVDVRTDTTTTDVKFIS